MLLTLSIKNLAIAEHIELDFRSGMTIITGETGAGKSLVIDALTLLAGGKADAGQVRHGVDRAEISAEFDVSKLLSAASWLSDQDLSDGQHLILRRVIAKEGRSRAYINGQAVPLSQLKDIGQQMLEIHSQHAQQALLDSKNHLYMLDEFASSTELRQQLQKQVASWQKQLRQLDNLRLQQSEMSAEIQLLDYQLEELEALEPTSEAFLSINQRHDELANVEQIQQTGWLAASRCQSDDGDDALGSLNFALQQLTNLGHPGFDDAIEMLESAKIQVQESVTSIQHLCDGLERDDALLANLAEQLQQYMSLARKHQCAPEDLPKIWQALSERRQSLFVSDEDIEAQESLVATEKDKSQAIADKLSKQRHQAASKLAKAVIPQLKALSLVHAQFEARLTPISDANQMALGQERVEFVVSMNPGQPLQALQKVASGGELSRISLAIEVVCASTSQLSALVFDEVDVGISGGTAEIVGRLLKQLSQDVQVLCISHQPQVAAQANQHLFVSKEVKQGNTRSKANWLGVEARTEEIARMLGGVELTDQTWAHAREMLEHANAH